MSNKLLSLSLTDMHFNDETSINTSDAINMILQKGGEFEYNNTTNLIIGVALLAIAGVIFIGENNYETAIANIDYINCNVSNCIVGAQFLVNGNTYKKDFIVDMSFTRPTNNKVTITYQIENPNNNYLGTSNYDMIMYILTAVGIFFIGIWHYLSSGTNTNSSFYTPSLSVYTKTETPAGLYEISKK